jgi:hypothetical protein
LILGQTTWLLLGIEAVILRLWHTWHFNLVAGGCYYLTARFNVC